MDKARVLEVLTVMLFPANVLAGWISPATRREIPNHFPSFLFNNTGRVSCYPFITGDTFRNFCDFALDEVDLPFNPDDVKPGDTIFLHSSPIILGEFFRHYHHRIKSKYIIVTQNHDFWMPGQFGSYLDDPKLIAWFSINIDRQHPKLIAIPRGISNPNWGEHGDPNIFRNALLHVPLLNERESFDVYLNITSNTNIGARQPVINYFRDKSFCFHAPRKNISGYLEDLKKFKFIISPPGNGIDCHRHWEALLMGAIPIIQHSPLDPLFVDLPVILIHHWDEVTPDFLKAKYHELERKEFKMEKIYIDYWLDLIRSYKKI